MKELSKKEQAINWLKYGERGDYVEQGNRMAIRLDGFANTLPACNLYENNRFIGVSDSFSYTVQFLFG